MPSARRSAPARLDARGPLVFDVRPLSRRAGSVRTEQRRVPAPGGLGTQVAWVPRDAELLLDLRLEAVTEGVLVTAAVRAPMRGECVRCLNPVNRAIEVSCQELFSYGQPVDDGGDGYALHGDLLDFEPALRDALVLALPLAPLCQQSCPGLCPDCGVSLAEVGPGHGHERIDARWQGLRAAAVRLGTEFPPAAGSGAVGNGGG